MSYGTSSYGEAAYGELGGDSGTIQGIVADGLSLSETIDSAAEFNNTFAEASTVNDTQEGQIVFNNFVNEDVEVDNLIELKQILQIIDAMTVSDAVSAPGSFSVYAVDSAAMNETVLISFSTSISEAIELGDVNVVNKSVLETILNLIELSDTSLTIGTFTVPVEDGIYVDDNTYNGYLATVLENLEASDVFTIVRYATVEQADQVALSETLINSLVYSIETIASAMLGEAVSSQQDGNVGILENILLSDVGESPQTFDTFTMNPENYAVTKYTFGFTESAVFGREFLMADSTGLYELGGTTDDGDNIVATIQTAALDFGTSNVKQVPSCMFGTNGTDLILKVSVDGALTSHYVINERNSGLMTKHIPLGKGPVGRYWQFELITDENSDLDLDTFEFYPVIFKRKRNG